MKLTKKSGLTGKEHTRELPITEKQYGMGLLFMEKGAMIQSAFSMLSADDREFIMTGITPEEWAETFKDEADGYEPDINDVLP